jgi:hypothetical protein
LLTVGGIADESSEHDGLQSAPIIETNTIPTYGTNQFILAEQHSNDLINLDKPDTTEMIIDPPLSLPHDQTPLVTRDLERRAQLLLDEVLMHVDTGANGTVTCMSGELHNITPARIQCSSAKLGESDLCQF